MYSFQADIAYLEKVHDCDTIAYKPDSNGTFMLDSSLNNQYAQMDNALSRINKKNVL